MDYKYRTSFDEKLQKAVDDMNETHLALSRRQFDPLITNKPVSATPDRRVNAVESDKPMADGD